MKSNSRKLAMTAMLAAIASILMFLEFSIPVMPTFVKLDISELPALVAAFAIGPASGAAVCLVKNIVNAAISYSGGVGEVCNFLLGVCFVVPAGLIYKFRKNRCSALIGSLAGAVIMGLVSVPVNYFITYPMYQNFMPLEQIIAAYQAIIPSVNGLLSCLVIFNMPFTIFKGLICAAVTFLIYKRISVIIKGK